MRVGDFEWTPAWLAADFFTLWKKISVLADPLGQPIYPIHYLDVSVAPNGISATYVRSPLLPATRSEQNRALQFQKVSTASPAWEGNPAFGRASHLRRAPQRRS